MVLEFLILVGVLLFVPFVFGNLPLTLLFLFLVAICVPVLRLIFQLAPPFVPTPMKTVNAMVKLANIRKGDTVFDLGCGDGRILRVAAEKGAHATGYELSVPTLFLAKFRTRKHRNVSVRYADFWKKDYRDADVIFCYLLIQKMKVFHEKIWPTLKPGTRVVSHAFPMPIKPAARDGDALLYVKS